MIALLAFGCSSSPPPTTVPKPEPPRPVILWGPGGSIQSPTRERPQAKRGQLCPQLLVDGDDRLLMTSYFPRHFEEDLGYRVLVGEGFTGEIAKLGGLLRAAAYRDVRIIEAATSQTSSGFLVFGEAVANAQLEGVSIPKGYFLASMDSRGRVRWVRPQEPYTRHLLVDDQGSTIVVSEWSRDIPGYQAEFDSKSTLSKYGGRGELVWRRVIQGISWSSAIAHADSMYLAHTSSCSGETCNHDVRLEKFTAQGVSAWQKLIVKSEPSADEPLATTKMGSVSRVTTAMDRSGNMYWAGNFFYKIRLGSTIMQGPVFTSVSLGDTFLAKIGPQGDVLYARHIPGDAMSVQKLVVDPKGRLWMTGSVYPGSSSTLFSVHPPPLPADYGDRYNEPPTHYVARFDPAGELLSAFEVARGSPISMTMDRGGDIFLTSIYTGGLALKGLPDARAYDYGSFGCAVLRIPAGYDPRAFEQPSTK